MDRAAFLNSLGMQEDMHVHKYHCTNGEDVVMVFVLSKNKELPKPPVLDAARLSYAGSELMSDFKDS